ncbi:MAG: terminase large subunit domain-containing protein [Gaiellaceae bacterium]
MPQRRKGLAERVAENRFEARRPAHRALLETEELVEEPGLRALQQRYRRLKLPAKRYDVAAEFEAAIRGRHDERLAATTSDFMQAIAELGPPGSAQQVIRFFPRFFRFADGKTFQLERWQQDFIREAFRLHPDGSRVYKEVLLGVPRGSGKTPLASGLALHALMTAPGAPQVFQAAGSAKQAKFGIDYARTFVKSGDLGRWVRPGEGGLKRRDDSGFYAVIAAGGGALNDGANPDVGILDEWHAYTTTAQQRTKTSYDTAMDKKLWAYLLAITTAGHNKMSQLGVAFDAYMASPNIERKRNDFLTIVRDEDAGQLMWWYGLPPGYELDLDDDKAVLRAIKLANPGSWAPHAALLRLLKRMKKNGNELEFIRLILNGWTVTKGSWLKNGVWGACFDDSIAIPDGAEIYVGVDSAHSRDCVAVAWAWRAPDGRIVVRVRIWAVIAEAPAHHHVDDYYDADDRQVAERFINEKLAGRYKIREVVADPNHFGTEIRILGQRFDTAPVWPNSNTMRECTETFYKLANGRRVAHNGNRLFNAHVNAISATKTSEGYYKLDKLDSNWNDGGVAAIIAVGRAARALPPKSRRVKSW